jgi:hypothetical protein
MSHLHMHLGGKDGGTQDDAHKLAVALRAVFNEVDVECAPARAPACGSPDVPGVWRWMVTRVRALWLQENWGAREGADRQVDGGEWRGAHGSRA